MLNVMIFRASHVMIAIGPHGGFLSNASASPNTITVQDPRPVDKAIQELEKRYGWQITYEDPPYSHFGEMTDVSDTDWPGTPIRGPSQLQSLQANNRTLVPKREPIVPRGSLSFTLPSANPDELGAVEALVKSYNASRGGNVFAVVRGTGVLHVVPRKAAGLSGNLEPVKPLLDTVITIEPKERTSYALIEEVLKKISIGTNTNVVMGGIPVNMLDNMKTSIGGSGKTARSILEQWILESRAPLSWLLSYEPSAKWFALNIYGLRNNSPARCQVL
jgi:hypothetical protein